MNVALVQRLKTELSPSLESIESLTFHCTTDQIDSTDNLSLLLKLKLYYFVINRVEFLESILQKEERSKRDEEMKIATEKEIYNASERLANHIEMRAIEENADDSDDEVRQTGVGFMRLCKFMHFPSRVRVLSLAREGFEPEKFYLLAEALKVNSCLETISLSGLGLTDQNALEFAGALMINKALEDVDLSWNEFSDKAVCEIAQALDINRTLKRLIIGPSKVHFSAALAFSKALKVNTTLQFLELAACDITDEVIHIIMKALHVNSSLESLDLSENLIGDDGAKSIAEALKVNYSIGELSLLCNVIEDDGAYEISSALDVNKSLRILNMNENPLSSDGVSSIVDSFGDSHLHVEVDLDQIDQIEYSMQIGDMLETNHFDRVKHLKFLLCAMLKSQSLQRFDWSLISSNIFPFIGNDCPYERE